MFGPEHAAVHELVRRHRGKDWAAEARDLAARVRALHPSAASLLDVGCATGAHLDAFRTWFDHVEGLEPAPAMREHAERRLPGVPVHAADMRDFDLGRTFDAVTCLCTSVGHLDTTEDLSRALARMAAHLAPGGVLVVEPWWLPERFLDGYVGSDLVRDGDRVLARVSHTTRRGRVAHLEMQWVIGEPSGLRSFALAEAFTLFTADEYLDAFAQAGCPATRHEEWLTGRGLFVGVRSA
jgi:SAM-dependent methyltransferase